MKILDLKKKNCLKFKKIMCGLNRKFNIGYIAEEKISELEDLAIGTTQNETPREKKD